MKARHRRIRYHPMNNKRVWRTSIHQLLTHYFLPYEEEMKRLGLSSLSGYKYEGCDKDKINECSNSEIKEDNMKDV